MAVCYVCKTRIAELDHPLKCFGCDNIAHPSCINVDIPTAKKATAGRPFGLRHCCPECEELPSLRSELEGALTTIRSLEAKVERVERATATSAPPSAQLDTLTTRMSNMDAKLDALIAKFDPVAIAVEVGRAVSKSVFEAHQEATELESKKCNAVVCHLEPSQDVSDVDAVKSMSQAAGLQPDAVEDAWRDGPSPNGMPRILKVRFNSIGAKKSFIDAGRRKKFPGQSGDNGVYVRPDLTFQQREAKRQKKRRDGIPTAPGADGFVRRSSNSGNSGATSASATGGNSTPLGPGGDTFATPVSQYAARSYAQTVSPNQ